MKLAPVVLRIAALAAAYALFLRSDLHRKSSRPFYRAGRPTRAGRTVARLSAAV